MPVPPAGNGNMSVRKWLSDLDEVEHGLAVAGRELEIAQSELNDARAAFDDAGFRMIVSETAQASAVFRKAASGIQVRRARCEEAEALIKGLSKEREQLLRRISAPASRG